MAAALTSQAGPAGSVFDRESRRKPQEVREHSHFGITELGEDSQTRSCSGHNFRRGSSNVTDWWSVKTGSQAPAPTGRVPAGITRSRPTVPEGRYLKVIWAGALSERGSHLVLALTTAFTGPGGTRRSPADEPVPIWARKGHSLAPRHTWHP